MGILEDIKRTGHSILSSVKQTASNAGTSASNLVSNLGRDFEAFKSNFNMQGPKIDLSDFASKFQTPPQVSNFQLPASLNNLTVNPGDLPQLPNFQMPTVTLPKLDLSGIQRDFEAFKTTLQGYNPLNHDPQAPINTQGLLGKIRQYNFNNPSSEPMAKAFRGETLTKQEEERLAFDMAMSFSPVGYTNVAGKVGSKILNQSQKAAQAKLEGLLTYTDDLMRRGLTRAQADKISYNQYLNMGKDVVTKEKVQEFKGIFAKWIGQKEAARTQGFEIGMKFNIPESEGLNIIKFMEDPTRKVSPQIKEIADGLRREFDTLYQEANKSGIDVGYIKQYVTHVWDASDDAVEMAYQRAREKFRFSNQRQIPTYEEGISVGLKPKYTNPAQIIAYYSEKLQTTKANLNFIKNLKRAGLLTEGQAPGLSPIIAPGFKEVYFAPSKIANILNRVFSPQDPGLVGRALEVGRKISGVAQDITLSGGIPKTPFNAFAIPQLGKELLSGRVFSPVASFARSFSGSASDDFFKSNLEVIKRMQSKNIPLNTSLDMSALTDRGFIKNTFGGSVGEVWDKTVNDPTFKRFMPQLQINLFKDVERAALGKGKSAEAAAEIAAKAVKNFYGLTDTGTQALRNKTTQDFVGTVFFAPKFREAMINFWINNIKAVTSVQLTKQGLKLNNPLALQNRANSFFLVGAILTYGAYDILNQKYTGRHLKDNPSGTEDKLLIPLQDGTTLGIPYLPSIATLPRAFYGMLTSAAKADFPEVLNRGKTFISSAFRPMLDVATNENYFGQQIYKDSDDSGERLKKIGLYLAGQYNHPYIRAAIEGLQGKQPTYQTILKATEAPVRFYDSDKLQSKYYFANRDEVLKQLSDNDRTVYNKLHAGSAVDEDGLPIYNKRSDMSNALDRLANPQVLQAEAQIALQTAQETKQSVNPFYLLEPKQQETVLMLKTFYPGDSTKSQITKANLSWLQPYWAQRDAYVADLKSKGIIEDNPSFNTRPQASALVEAKLQAYNNLPSGTGARSNFLRANPDVTAFFDQSKAYTNEQRADLGLPLLAGTNSGSGFSNLKKGTKLTLPKSKAPKIKLAKLKAIKAPKMSFKTAKIKAPKFTAKASGKVNISKFLKIKERSKGGVRYG